MKDNLTIIVEGGKQLSGSVVIQPNKNAVLPAIALATLTSKPCILRNIPNSPDVTNMLQAITTMGGKVTIDHLDSGLITVSITCKELNQVVPDCVKDMQAGILFAGPLLARFGSCTIPLAIGCKLGYRGPEGHIKYLNTFGVACTVGDDSIYFSADIRVTKDHSLVRKGPVTTKRYKFSEALVTPTENLLMFLSSFTAHIVTVSGIAQEPHVACLRFLLQTMGMNIQGAGNTLTISGNIGILRGFEFDFLNEPDFVDFYGIAVSAAMTKSDITLVVKPTEAIMDMVQHLQDISVVCEVLESSIVVRGSQSHYQPTDEFAKAAPDTWKLDPGPAPGFPVDCLPSFVAMACMNDNPGTHTAISNWMYTDGLGYVPGLKRLGADISLEHKKHIVVHSQQVPFGNLEKEVTIECVPVIEGCRALFMGALARKGTTVLVGIEPLLRRNPDFITYYQRLGADITIQKSV